MLFQMKISLFLLIIFCSICPMQSNGLFDIQDTLTILCNRFSLISTMNDSSLQCARLRIDENVPSTDFNLNNPSQIILFIIIDQPSSSSSDIASVNIIVNYNESSDFSSSINEIRIGLQVIHSGFTINNQTTLIYPSYQIPILHWTKSAPDTYNIIDLITLNSNEYKTDTSMCQWNADRWNHLFNGNSTNKSSYAYILKTQNTDLIFTLEDTNNITLPSPYLNLLYCISYKLGTTELVLIIICGLFSIISLVTLGTLHYLKVEDNLARYFQHNTRDISSTHSNRQKAPVSSIEYVD